VGLLRLLPGGLPWPYRAESRLLSLWEKQSRSQVANRLRSLKQSQQAKRRLPDWLRLLLFRPHPLLW
jgi:hypothetical protein